MRKKLLVLLLSLTMVLGMAIPSFAATTAANSNELNLDNPTYLALGDSIATGFRGGSKGETDEYNKFQEFYTSPKYKKNSLYNTWDTPFEPTKSIYKHWTCNTVPYGFPNLFAKSINADPAKSINGSYVSLRAKDYCYILGIDRDNPRYSYTGAKTYTEEQKEIFNKFMDDMWNGEASIADVKDDSSYDMVRDYYNDPFGNFGFSFWKPLSYDNMSAQYNEWIRTADVITVELGANDLNALTQGDLMNKVMPALFEVMEKTTNLQEAKAIRTLLTDMNQFLAIGAGTEQNNPVAAQVDQLEKIANDVVDLQKFNLSLLEMGTSVSSLLKTGITCILDTFSDYRYWFDMLMSHINKNKKPDAVVIVTTIPNVLWGDESYSKMFGWMLGNDDLDIDLESIITPVIAEMNSYLYRNARIYNYRVADLSKVCINPEPKDTYSFHPDNAGHQLIADALKEAYDATLAERRLTSRYSFF